MCDEQTLRDAEVHLRRWGNLTRREFGALSVGAGLVRQANWQKVGGESPLERRTNQPRFSASRASGTVRGQAKRR